MLLRKWNQCDSNTLKNRLPILKWIPTYDLSTFLQDVLAGVTVGATVVAQGLAYAAVAGLPPEYGLYSGIVGGFVYLLFGNCRTMSIGPTAILSALIAKYVSGLSVDFAVVATFLAGVIQLVLGVCQLGFLVEFLSQPVTAGFVAAAAIQIIASQLKALFGTHGKSGNSFVESVYIFFLKLETINLLDTLLGLSTIAMLIFLKMAGNGCSRNDYLWRRLRWFLSLARNAVVVILGSVVAYIVHTVTKDRLILTVVGEINAGLPNMQLPKFYTTIGNETYTFMDILQNLGSQAIVLPLIGIMEVIVISKAFTPDTHFDAMQEIITLGLCNLIGCFFGSMPVTGSFSRSALYHASGVQTTMAGAIASLIVVLSLSTLTSLFFFIPKATLAGLIIMAVTALINVEDIMFIWRSSFREFVVLLSTMITSLTLGLEHGVVAGVLMEVFTILYRNARPVINENNVKIGDEVIAQIFLPIRVSYCSGEYIRRMIIQKIHQSNVGTLIVIDGTHTKILDTTAASDIMSIFNDIDERHYKIVFLNFKEQLQNILLMKNGRHKSKFINSVTIEKLLQQEQRIAEIGL